MKLKNTYLAVRHGQALSNVLNVSDVLGNPKNHLTEDGRGEAYETGKKLLGTRIDIIVASPFPRAKETAEIIADVIGFPKEKIALDPQLKEMNHGSEGQWKPICYSLDTQTPKEKLSRRDGVDAENYYEVRARTLKMIVDCEQKYKGKTILLVTHRSPMWMLYTGVWKLSDEETLVWEKDERSDDSALSSGGVLALNVPPELHDREA